MISLRKYINENFSITRRNMPQIENMDAFLSLVASVGLDYEYLIVDASILKPSQSEGFDQDKISAIANDLTQNPDPDQQNPIIISEDLYIIDGHHRAMAGATVGVEIPAYKVYTTANKLLKLINDNRQQPA